MIRLLYEQILVISRNIVKFIMQISYCSKYSLESIFSDVIVAIVNAIVFYFEVNSKCFADNSKYRKVISYFLFLLLVNFEQICCYL